MCIYISYVLFIQYVLSKYWYLWQMQMILMTKNRWRKCIFIYLNALKERILNISPNGHHIFCVLCAVGNILPGRQTEFNR